MAKTDLEELEGLEELDLDDEPAPRKARKRSTPKASGRGRVGRKAPARRSGTKAAAKPKAASARGKAAARTKAAVGRRAPKASAKRSASRTAARSAKSNGKPVGVSDIAREIGCDPQAVRLWLRAHRDEIPRPDYSYEWPSIGSRVPQRIIKELRKRYEAAPSRAKGVKRRRKASAKL